MLSRQFIHIQSKELLFDRFLIAIRTIHSKLMNNFQSIPVPGREIAFHACVAGGIPSHLLPNDKKWLTEQKTRRTESSNQGGIVPDLIYIWKSTAQPAGFLIRLIQ